MRALTALPVLSTFLLAAPALVVPALAAPPACTAEAIGALHVPDVTITAAEAVPAKDGQPAYCRVQGSVITRGDGAPDGKAGFMMQLPETWRQRFYFVGVGGNAGNFTPSANPADRAVVLGKGYATAITDTGHTGDGFVADWANKADGKPDPATRADFFYRAAHVVTVTGKKLAAAYYGGAVQRAYFDGCSTGGRMAMMEADRYPTDYDGIIAGDPAMDYRSQLGRLLAQKAQFSSPAAYIPASLVPAIDKAVTAACDANDGVKDGLVQNPATCAFKPETLLCKPGQTSDCLSAAQVETLRVYLSPVRDHTGKAIYPAMTPTDLDGPRGMAAWTLGLTTPDLTNLVTPWGPDIRRAPSGFNYSRQAVAFWAGLGPDVTFAGIDADPKTGRIGEALLTKFDATFAGAITRDPKRLDAFVKQGRKMIIYHGFSDPAISPFRTTQFYQEFAALHGGYPQAAKSVRLFMVPGMAHCSLGPGPENFNTIDAIEAWVEHGQAPDSILATATAPGSVKRTMPLCPFPTQATYKGAGDVNDAANWSCAPNRKLLETAAK